MTDSPVHHSSLGDVTVTRGGAPGHAVTRDGGESDDQCLWRSRGAESGGWGTPGTVQVDNPARLPVTHSQTVTGCLWLSHCRTFSNVTLCCAAVRLCYPRFR